MILEYVFYLVSQCNHCGRLLPSFAESVEIVVPFPRILSIYKIHSNFKLSLEFKFFSFLTSGRSKHISNIHKFNLQ